jgi:glycolate oxidase FAD binding subunit
MSLLPLISQEQPATTEALSALVRTAYANKTVVYPLGGETSLAFGLPVKRVGLGISLQGMQRVVDYPARDMTITVEAGITMQTLAETLLCEQQHLPVDVPTAKQATLGGVLATNWNGPRRYGYGSLRDFVIGIEAVDGTGRIFHGGGRVVKNVAGYDFCKLLTGSWGCLGIITQVTLKVRPLPEKVLSFNCELKNLTQVQQWLESVQNSPITPTALLVTSAGEKPGHWYAMVRLEGTTQEVDWMAHELTDLCSTHAWAMTESADADTWQAAIEFPAQTTLGYTLKTILRPSGVTPWLQLARAVDPACQCVAHIGNGLIFTQFSASVTPNLLKQLMTQLRPAAVAWQGYAIVLQAPNASELTLQSMWGAIPAYELQRSVKQKFDPAGILNAERFPL